MLAVTAATKSHPATFHGILRPPLSHSTQCQSTDTINRAIGAVVATIPTCWYLWPSASHADAHHDQPETKHERAEKLTHEADNHEPAETEEKSTPDSKGSTDDVQFKGKSAAGDEDNKVDDTRKVEDDEKGGKKLRIDSAAAKELGTGEKRREDGSENVRLAHCLHCRHLNIVPIDYRII